MPSSPEFETAAAWGHAPRVFLPGDCGAQSDQGASGGEPGRTVRAGAPQAEAGVSGPGGVGSGRPGGGLLQQLGAGESDAEAAAGKKFACFRAHQSGTRVRMKARSTPHHTRAPRRSRLSAVLSAPFTATKVAQLD